MHHDQNHPFWRSSKYNVPLDTLDLVLHFIGVAFRLILYAVGTYITIAGGEHNVNLIGIGVIIIACLLSIQAKLDIQTKKHTANGTRLDALIILHRMASGNDPDEAYEKCKKCFGIGTTFDKKNRRVTCTACNGSCKERLLSAET